jgi:excinuclease UvrABC nuclease subunit
LNDKYKISIKGKLQGLPGIGPKRARLLLNQFGSVKAIIDAVPADMEKIPGMGKDTVKKINSIIE